MRSPFKLIGETLSKIFGRAKKKPQSPIEGLSAYLIKNSDNPKAAKEHFKVQDLSKKPPENK